jgi:hypothetical protein
VAIFEGDVGARQSTSVKSTTAVAVFLLSQTSTAPNNSWSLNTSTRGYTVINTGPNPCWVGTSTSVTAATGFRLGSGEQLTVAGTIHKLAACASAAAPASVIAGLASVYPVV